MASKRRSEDSVTDSGNSPAPKAPAKQKASRTDAEQKRARSAPTSTYFNKTRARARKMINDPEALKRVADESHRSGASRSGQFAAVMDDFHALVRLVVAYARGNYRDIAPDS